METPPRKQYEKTFQQMNREAELMDPLRARRGRTVKESHRRHRLRNEFGIPIPYSNLENYMPGLDETATLISVNPNGTIYKANNDARRKMSEAQEKYQRRRARAIAAKAAQQQGGGMFDWIFGKKKEEEVPAYDPNMNTSGEPDPNQTFYPNVRNGTIAQEIEAREFITKKYPNPKNRKLRTLGRRAIYNNVWREQNPNVQFQTINNSSTLASIPAAQPAAPPAPPQYYNEFGPMAGMSRKVKPKQDPFNPSKYHYPPGSMPLARGVNGEPMAGFALGGKRRKTRKTRHKHRR